MAEMALPLHDAPARGPCAAPVSYDDDGASARFFIARRFRRWSFHTATRRELAMAGAFDVGEYGVGRLASPLEPNTRRTGERATD